ncbi:hypothetical protein [Azospirillum sp. B506]|uniref:hypothetical protein n=1 Tax=Azospirillum sp. B506 TaxID=137721 RepID=UPI000678C5A4|nr:hypothetical protein [Azospirillum sp. B506]
MTSTSGRRPSATGGNGEGNGSGDDPDLVCFNGVDAATGRLLIEPMPLADLAALAVETKVFDAAASTPLVSAQQRRRLGLSYGVDPSDVAQAGWGVLFAPGTGADVRDALAPLLEHRRRQAGKRFRSFDVQAGEDAVAFLARHDVGLGDVNPNRVPLYLLIIGEPKDIPYDFQYLLDADYAVGRIAFDDVDDYHRYATALVRSETQPAGRRSAAVFATRNPGDRATKLSATRLARPLLENLRTRMPNWAIREVLDEQATKPALSSLINAADRPSVLFTACHGIGFPPDDPDLQKARQGALLCQEWRPLSPGPVPPDFYFGADDIPGDAALDGMVAFHFACYGAGSPDFDDFRTGGDGRPLRLAPDPFVAALPKRMLRQGASAVIGHVDRAWAYSFMWRGISSYVDAFVDSLHCLLDGKPVGLAAAYFDDRFKTVSVNLLRQIALARNGIPINELSLANDWIICRDARNYTVVGDPAARISFPPPAP